MKSKKLRLFAIFLAFVMVFGLMPTTALADGVTANAVLVSSGNIGAGGAPWRLYDDGSVIVSGGTAIIAATAANSPFGGNVTERNSVRTITFTDTVTVGTANSLASLFRLTYLETIHGLGYLNSGNVTTMANMFNGAQNLTNLDLSDLNTGSVTNMTGMFQGAVIPAGTDLAGLNNGSVTNMTSMFNNATFLADTDLAGMNTDSVTNMSNMFNGANLTALPSLDLTGWNIGDVTNMSGMFQGARLPADVNLSWWNTDSVTNMSNMFNNANLSVLTSLNLSGWSTGANANLTGMFQSATFPANVNLSNWDTGRVTDMSGMFYSANLSALTSLELPDWSIGANTTVNVSLANMFQNATLPANVNLSGWDTSRVNTMNSMFRYVTSATNLNLSGWEIGTALTTGIREINNIFYGVDNLTGLDLTGWDTGNVTQMWGLFENAVIPAGLDISGWNTGSVTMMNRMFTGATLPTGFDLSEWNVEQVIGFGNMFQNMTGPTYLNLFRVDTSTLAANVNVNMANMFTGAGSLTSLDVSDWDTRQANQMHNIFNGASGLTRLDLSNWDNRRVSVGSRAGMFTGASNLRELTLGEHFRLEPTSGLDIVGAAYTGRWQNVGAGTPDYPLGAHAFTSAELMAAANASTVAGETWVWQRRPAGQDVSALHGLLAVANVHTDYNNRHTWATWIPFEAARANATGVYGNVAATQDEINAAYASLRSAYDALVVDDTISEVGRITTNNSNLPWRLHEGGRLVLKPGTIGTGTATASPWNTPAARRNSIISIEIYGPVTALPSMQSLFRNLPNLTSITGMQHIDTSAVTNMSQMFNATPGLTVLDLSGWDTGAVTNMSNMFNGAVNLTSLNLSGWNTGSVTNMQNMFNAATLPANANLSGLNTGSVTNMQNMFNGATLPAILDLSGWNTGNVQNMTGLFQNVRDLTSLDLTGWYVGRVNNMTSMFRGAASLTDLEIFDAEFGANVNLSNMFQDATGLTSIDLSGWSNTYRINNTSNMFSGAYNLTSIDLSGWNTNLLSNMSSMFQGTTSLRYLDFQVNSSATLVGALRQNMQSMFQNTGLTSLDISDWDTRMLNNTSYMFRDATNLTDLTMFQLDASGIDTGIGVSVVNMSSMFQNATGLTNLDLSGWDTTRVSNMNDMFNGAANLESLDLSGWNTGAVTAANMNRTFLGASSLRDLTLGEQFLFRISGAANPGLPDPPVNNYFTSPPIDNYFTGNWRNVGNGTPSIPEGVHVFTSAELMAAANANAASGERWVWQPSGQGIVTVDLAALQALINEATSRVQSNYTAGSWRLLATKLAVAQTALGNADATQTMINSAAAALQEAIAALLAVNIPVPGPGTSPGIWEPGSGTWPTGYIIAVTYGPDGAIYISGTSGISISSAGVYVDRVHIDTEGRTIFTRVISLGAGVSPTYGLYVDASGNIFLGVRTANATEVRKFSPDGTLLRTCHVGTNSAINLLEGMIYTIAADSAGNLFVGGGTRTDLQFAVSPRFDFEFFTYRIGGGNHANNAQRGFIAKFDAHGVLSAATYWGGSVNTAASTGSHSRVDTLKFDERGNLYAFGIFASHLMGTAFANNMEGAFQQTLPGGLQGIATRASAFVARFDPGNLTPLSATYLGGPDGTESAADFVFHGNYLYLIGATTSNDFPKHPEAAVHDNATGDHNWSPFIARLNRDLTGDGFAATEFPVTFAGQPLRDQRIAVDDGGVFAAGFTQGMSTTDGTPPNGIFLAELDHSLSNIRTLTMRGQWMADEPSFTFPANVRGLLLNDNSLMVVGNRDHIGFERTTGLYRDGVPMGGGLGYILTSGRDIVIPRLIGYTTDTEAGAFLLEGDTIRITAHFPVPVEIHGTGYPRLAMNTTNAQRFAEFVEGNGTNALIFEYTVQEGDRAHTPSVTAVIMTPLDVGIPAFDSGFQTTFDTTDVVIRTLQGDAVDVVTPPLIGNRLVNNRLVYLRPYGGPTMISISVSSPNAQIVNRDMNHYTPGTEIMIAVRFDDNILEYGGEPRLRLNVMNDGEPLYAEFYRSDAGSNSFIFRYVIEEGDTTEGQILVADALDLNGGFIRDRHGNYANLRLPGGGRIPSIGVAQGSSTLIRIGRVIDSGDPTVWDGSIDISWYNETDTVFYLTTAAQLAGFAQLVNNGNSFQGKTVTLGADIDLGGIEQVRGDLSDNGRLYTRPVWGGQEWTPIGRTIGAPAVGFAGTFDGGFHSISNVYVPGTANRAGLFGQIDVGGVVRNVIIASGYIRGGNHVGGVAGRNYGTIENSANHATIEGGNLTPSGQGTGGIVGANWRTTSGAPLAPVVRNSYNAGIVVTFGTHPTDASPGGIAGCNEGLVENSYNIGRGARFGEGNAFTDLMGGITGIRRSGDVQNSHTLSGTIDGVVFPSTISANPDTNANALYSEAFKNPDDMRTDAFVTRLNAGGSVFALDTRNANNGFPVLNHEGIILPVPVLERLEITAPPTKTEYTAGETFDPTGMVVTAIFSDDSTEAVTTFTWSPTRELETGDTIITISYTRRAVTRSATQAIVVQQLPVTVDRTVLNTAIAEAEALTEADHTATSWSDLQTALATAIDVRDNANATQTQVDQAQQNLTTALDSLVVRPDLVVLTIRCSDLLNPSFPPIPLTETQLLAHETTLENIIRRSGPGGATENLYQEVTGMRLNSLLSFVPDGEYAIEVRFVGTGGTRSGAFVPGNAHHDDYAILIWWSSDHAGVPMDSIHFENLRASLHDHAGAFWTSGVRYVEVTVTPATPNPVTSIAVTTQPTTLTYTTGDTLNLAGLVVTLTYQDNSTRVVTFAQFAENGITATPVHGSTVLQAHNGYPVTIQHTASAQTASTANLTVTAAPAGTFTIILRHMVGDVLVESDRVQDWFVSPTRQLPGEPVNIFAGTKPGHTFVEWDGFFDITTPAAFEMIRPPSSGYVDIIPYNGATAGFEMPAGHVIITAHWERTSWDVVFDMAGGQYGDETPPVTIVRQIVDRGANATLPDESEIRREGNDVIFEFIGWALQANAATVLTAAELEDALTNITEDVTFFAQWVVYSVQRSLPPVTLPGHDEPLDITVTVTNEFNNAMLFTGSHVTVSVTGATPNQRLNIRTYVGFTITSNPTVDVAVPVDVEIDVDGDGAGYEIVFVSFSDIVAVHDSNADPDDFTSRGFEEHNVIGIPGNDGVMVGDVNGDGRVTSADATALARWIVACDNNCDCDAGECPRDAIIPPYRLANARIRLRAPYELDSLPDSHDLVFLARWLVGHNVEGQITPRNNGNSRHR